MAMNSLGRPRTIRIGRGGRRGRGLTPRTYLIFGGRRNAGCWPTCRGSGRVRSWSADQSHDSIGSSPSTGTARTSERAAEPEGSYSLLIPTRVANGLFGDTAPLAETWTTVTELAAVTRRIRFLVAIRPGFISTGLFGQMAAALDQINGGRLDINMVPGGIQGDF